MGALDGREDPEQREEGRSSGGGNPGDDDPAMEAGEFLARGTGNAGTVGAEGRGDAGPAGADSVVGGVWPRSRTKKCS